MSIKGNKIVICDKKFTQDIIKTFENFIQNYNSNLIYVYVEEHAEDRAELDYKTE
jgi:prephenate dehydrogenase